LRGIGKVRRGPLPVAPFIWAAAAWAAIVSAILTWQAFEYRGLYAWAAEWQFRHFDRMFPVATIVLFTALLSLPFLLLIGFRVWRQRQLYGRPKAADRLQREEQISWLLGVSSVFALLLSLLLLAMALAVGGLSEKPAATLSLTSAADVPNGMTTARGWLLLDRKGFYTESALFGRRDLMVAPLVASGGDNHIRYFVQIDKLDHQEPQFRSVEGLLRRKSLPGGLETLYENSGYVIDRPTYILYDSRAAARWPLLSAAADLAFFAFLFGVGFGLHRLHLRKLRRKPEPAPRPKERPRGFFNQ